MRNNNPDKYLDGNELSADYQGFAFEFALCYAFKQSYPNIYTGRKVDKFDLHLTVPDSNRQMLLYRFDAKNSKDCLINAEQFEKKRDVDAYLFGELDHVNADPWICELKIFGWIEKNRVKQVAELAAFENGSKAYRIPKEKLNKSKPFAVIDAGEWEDY